MTAKSTIEFKIAKSGHLVPIVDQVFLHSIYDPIKEAEVFVESHASEIENNSTALILGLGFAYHAIQTFDRLKEIHGARAQLIVVEANQQLVERFISYTQDKNLKIGFHIFTGDVQAVYSSDRFLDFLLKRPNVFVHRASFQKDKNYYESFLKFNAPQAIAGYWNALRPGLRDYMQSFSSTENSLEQVGEEAATKNELKPQDYFVLFANALRQTQAEKI